MSGGRRATFIELESEAHLLRKVNHLPRRFGACSGFMWPPAIFCGPSGFLCLLSCVRIQTTYKYPVLACGFFWNRIIISTCRRQAFCSRGRPSYVKEDNTILSTNLALCNKATLYTVCLQKRALRLIFKARNSAKSLVTCTHLRVALET